MKYDMYSRNNKTSYHKGVLLYGALISCAMVLYFIQRYMNKSLRLIIGQKYFMTF